MMSYTFPIGTPACFYAATDYWPVHSRALLPVAFAIIKYPDKITPKCAPPHFIIGKKGAGPIDKQNWNA